jgi:enoyl-CoA hydratase
VTNLILTETRGPVQIITINRPEVRNAVNIDTAKALYAAFLDFEDDDDAKVAVFTGSDGAFCGGYDLKMAAKGVDQSWFDEHAIHSAKDMGDRKIGPMGPSRLQLSKPVIAAVEGPAVAGGMELALWADMRVMARTAFFGVYCRRWGVPLIDGGAIRLPRIVGQSRAMDLILTGRKCEADEALAIGLANRVVEHGMALDVALALAEDLARFPQACMRADRSVILDQWSLPRTDAFSREWQSAETFTTEGIKGAGRFSSGKGRSGNFDDI